MCVLVHRTLQITYYCLLSFNCATFHAIYLSTVNSGALIHSSIRCPKRWYRRLGFFVMRAKYHGLKKVVRQVLLSRNRSNRQDILTYELENTPILVQVQPLQPLPPENSDCCREDLLPAKMGSQIINTSIPRRTGSRRQMGTYVLSRSSSCGIYGCEDPCPQ